MICSRSLCFFLIVLVFVGLSTAQPPATSRPPVSLLITTPDQTVKRDSPIILNITMTNLSDHAVTYLVGSGYGWADVKVYDSTGNLAPETEERQRVGHPKSGSVVSFKKYLPPGKKVESVIDVRRHYRLSPGEYKIQVQYSDPENTTGIIESNVVTVVITE
jgi:hypothetical protein